MLLRATDTPLNLALKATVSPFLISTVMESLFHLLNISCPSLFGLSPAEADVLVISIQNVSEGGQSYLRVRLQCNSMDLAAELVQDLAKYFKLDELESEADFPAEFREFEEVNALWTVCCMLLCFSV